MVCEIFEEGLARFDGTMMLLVALISCGFGINADNWALKMMTVVLVRFRG